MVAGVLFFVWALALVAKAAPANMTVAPRGGPGSTKLGIGYPVQEKDASPVRKLLAAGSAITWWYNWNNNAGPRIFPQGPGDDIPGFIPMIFDPTFIENGDPRPAVIGTLFTYNEPDMVHDLSTAVTATETAAQWKSFVPKIRANHPGAKIAAPAVAHDHAWLQTFFAGVCPGATAASGWAGCDLRPDFLNVHAYSADVQQFKDMVSAWHNEFGLPVIVSEFACHSFGAPAYPSQQQVNNFMGSVTKWMDNTDWIVKYAWFGAMRNKAYLYGVSDTNRLLDDAGNVTPLGRQYMAGGHK